MNKEYIYNLPQTIERDSHREHAGRFFQPRRMDLRQVRAKVWLADRLNCFDSVCILAVPLFVNGPYGDRLQIMFEGPR